MIIFPTFIILVTVLGAFLPLPIVLIIVGTILYFHCKFLLYAITLGIPTLILLTCWKVYSYQKVSRGVLCVLYGALPLACSVVFAMHNVGLQAALFTGFWFVSPLLFYLGFIKRSIIWASVAHSFIMHAVGSVLWLYSVPTTPGFWYGLIPLVILERLVIACAMVITYL
jgi:hypothetical protein